MSDTREYQELVHMNRVTKKDVWVAFLLNNAKNLGYEIDPASRIVPTIFFQPHFSAIVYSIDTYENNFAQLESKEYEKVIHSPFFREFKYIKTFTPLRRSTTSYGGAVRFMLHSENGGVKLAREKIATEQVILEPGDLLTQQALNRSFMIDGQERLFKDSILVRFEDGKLNPKATFTALAEFLDIPYTESLTCCSNYLGIDPETTKGNARGFDPSSVYKKYDEFATDEERAYLEYMLRDAYEYYGYDFHYYDGQPMTNERLDELFAGFTILNRFATGLYNPDGTETDEYAALSEEKREAHRLRAETLIAGMNDNRRKAVEILGKDLQFVNKNGQPLRMMPLLKLDPELLETELYH